MFIWGAYEEVGTHPIWYITFLPLPENLSKILTEY